VKWLNEISENMNKVLYMRIIGLKDSTTPAAVARIACFATSLIAMQQSLQGHVAALVRGVTHIDNHFQRRFLGVAGGPVRTLPPPLCALPPNETGCKVAGLHNSCIHSVASHSWWCRITPFTQSCSYPKFLPPKWRCGHPKLLQLETPLAISGS